MKKSRNEVLANLTMSMAGRLLLTRMLTKEFGISFGRAWRWTAIGIWAAYFVGRNVQCGRLSLDRLDAAVKDLLPAE